MGATQKQGPETHLEMCVSFQNKVKVILRKVHAYITAAHIQTHKEKDKREARERGCLAVLGGGGGGRWERESEGRK